ncbi:MAG: TetR/AcrR family transcriptional regulator [Gammaproteobacteria bacterium]|nr:TetR/AcrR family transcriptional regulator [Gammaproteobacteria bacterium]MYD81440.1 TetR/AcrR family transcriptional regulator [Gammaproteobacteria bacterium]
MSKESRHAIRPRTLEAILDAAIRLFNADSGVTMTDIAKAAGVGRATLHRHFQDKDDLIQTLSARCMEEMNAAVRATDIPDEPAVKRLHAMLKSAIPLGDRFAFLSFERMEGEDLQSDYEEQLDWTTALIEQLKTEQAIATDVPTSWAVAQVDQVIWTAWTAVWNSELTPDEAANLALRTLLNGLS